MNETLSNILFTPAAVLDLLSSIDELKDLDIGITETLDGKIQCQVGSSIYEIDDSYAENLDVDKNIVDEIEDINQNAYEELDENYDRDSIINDTVEGGLIKQALKTLLIGGMVRLSAKMLK